MGCVNAEVLLQRRDLGGFAIGRRLVFQQIVQHALAQRALCNLQFVDAQQAQGGHQNAQAAGDDGSPVFLESSQADAVHVTGVHQLLMQPAQAVGRDQPPGVAVGRQDVSHGVGRA